MPETKSRSDPLWKNPLLWLVGIAGILLAVRFLLPAEVPDPLAREAKDKEHYIGLKSLPNGWRIEWETDKSSARRLKLVSPQGDANIEVLAFDGELDKKKFDGIGPSLYGASFPPPYSVTVTTEYGMPIQRSEYKSVIKAKQVMYTSIDVLWHESRTDYAYVVVAKSFRQSNPNVQVARGSLGFYPPRLTAFGKAGRRISSGLDFGEHWFAIVSWIAAIVWGLSYVARKLDEKWKPAKYLVGAGIIAVAVIARALFSLSWMGTLLVLSILIAAIGAAAALLTGAWELES